MTIRVALHHQSHYQFDRPVTLFAHEIRLRPAAHSRTPILAYSLNVSPTPHFIHWQQDAFGNFVARLNFPEPATEMTVTVDLVADMTVINPFDFFVEDYAEHYPFTYPAALAEELAPYRQVDALGSRFSAWIDQLRAALPADVSIINFLVALNQQAQSEISYLIRLEPGVQTPEETLTLRSGSCRDSAWLLVHTLRHFGIAARFVSGYLIQLAADEIPLSGPAGPSADFTDLHAWCEAYIPGAGWIGLDATSGLLAGEGHIPLAATAQPASAAPISGATSVCESELAVEMTVTRIFESPRVTKPYDDTQWQAIHALGLAVDRELLAGDVRLTQGGEPTFVAVDNREAPEWNTEALGADKWQRAQHLLRELVGEFAPGAVTHYGQGKWYPGEPLPRWALTAFWRTDGEPIWRHPALLADERTPPQPTEVAGRFMIALAKALGLSSGFIQPAYEDPLYPIRQEAELPVNLSVADLDLDDPGTRGELARVLRRGLSAPVGYVLPLRAGWGNAPAWQSSAWPLRSDRLLLLPGDSPLGLRLPINRLPWQDAPTMDFPPDPFAPQPPLAVAKTGAVPSSDKLPLQVRSAVPPAATEVVHTAITTEVRDGQLCVFMPPLVSLERWLALIAAIEQTAVALNVPVRIEGYTPPRDARLQSLSVTPDPGVIEVNIHPSQDWVSLVDRTERLYAAAKRAGLSAEKFMLDGRHTGTGGGNHVTLGGAVPADSPFLRRPDLLKSLLVYWQEHPALSYLFSGQFIGPTSQAPRVDEARDDTLGELEIALQQLDQHCPSGQENERPWLIDRILRNLLVDLTGNTHRAEFCIDKLYSPDSATGRLGLLELRAFEMPPHPRMSLVQSLLLRSLIARFWRTPYSGPLVPWGTALHDRFMLPYFVEQDLHDICRDLRAAGYPVQDAWFSPFLEFRFPLYGKVAYEGIEIELRQAIEPWHVLGEEMSGGGTARYVDSSVERVQIFVRGMVGNRHRISCNGREVPLHPTGVPGEFVAGVRFKAWAPYSALHPTIGVQAPLVVDLIDGWNHRSLGGCTYHVSHPGGRNYSVFPVNANEAEARRLARFWPHGHTPGRFTLIPEQRNPRFPLTLDLRRQPH
ncbi:DUF2126 domain-containing protein [Halothiobacillus sp. DCM-1]|uniref:transglutaminase family protein n=1 Tax=Halothiobacillus sp. DCM-1 TaxID=3112558 RepID=UPI0032439B9A